MLKRCHPNLFKTANCDCGNGWYVVLDMLSDALDASGACVVYNRICEKFGSLNVYWDPDDSARSEAMLDITNTVRPIISKYEDLALRICERCGLFNEDSIYPVSAGWMKRICENCQHLRSAWPSGNNFGFSNFEFSAHELMRQRMILSNAVKEQKIKVSTATS